MTVRSKSVSSDWPRTWGREGSSGFAAPDLIRVYGLSWRKRRLLGAFLPDSRLESIGDPEEARPGETLAVWASSPMVSAAAARPDLRVLRIEDGFLRSVGLGARLTRPLSWVIDPIGIYYDPSCPSGLEVLLSEHRFEPGLVSRAARLRERVVSEGISKYNVGNRGWTGLKPGAHGRRIALVTGQVETDASIRAGATRVNSNARLIAAARAAEPGAWLVFKPHPDVAAGLRNAGVGESAAAKLCDEIVVDAPIEALIDAADVVHVMTSQTGFEALLRGKEVHCHGLPFYAGWGLTTDRIVSPRRGRSLTLDELVAATLILYPRYVSLATGRLCPPEQALDELIEWRHRDTGRARWWQRLLRPVLHHA